MKKLLLILVIVFIYEAADCLAQSTVLYGINIGTSKITGTNVYNGSIASGGGGFTTAFHIGAGMKFSVPIPQMTPRVYFNYYRLRGNDTGVETSQNIFSLGFSTQFTITAGIISPYLALDGSYNYFDKFKYSTSTVYTPSSAPGSPANLSAISRFGGGFAIGADFNIIKNIDIDLSVRYNVMNLFSGESTETNLQFLTFNASVFF